MIINPRAKVCFKCKKYINIFPDNPIYQEKESKFDNKHAGHTIQIISKEEVYKNYEIERFKRNEKMR